VISVALAALFGPDRQVGALLAPFGSHASGVRPPVSRWIFARVAAEAGDRPEFRFARRAHCSQGGFRIRPTHSGNGETGPGNACRQRGGEPSSAPEEEVAIEERACGDLSRRILCAACRRPITSEAQRIRVRGRHEQRCVNPAGILFHIGCFRRAPGCRILGTLTHEFTWFPGFAWNYAVCAGCGVLLGWHYQGKGQAAFFGLILNRLALEEEGGH